MSIYIKKLFRGKFEMDHEFNLYKFVITFYNVNSCE